MNGVADVTENVAQVMGTVWRFLKCHTRELSARRALLANSRVGRKGAGNVRQTSVCRWFPPLVHRRKPRQTEVCRTFMDSPTVSVAPKDHIFRQCEGTSRWRLSRLCEKPRGSRGSRE